MTLPAANVDVAPATAVDPAFKAERSRRRFQAFTDVRGGEPSPEFVARIPIAFARRFAILGFADRDGGARVPVALGDPAHLEQAQVVSRLLGRPLRIGLAPATDILAAINAAYEQRTGQAQTFIETIDRRELLAEVQELTAREDLLDGAARAPVIRLVNLMLFEAVKARASDVHVQPYEGRLVVRTRVDGILYDAFELPKTLQAEIVGRVKVMGRMNIAEKRLAQDGRANVHVGDRSIDLRIATLPTSHGERVVIRLLDKSLRLYDLPELGMDGETLGRFAELVAAEHGIILVTGPTGSGKTTTLYAALKGIDAAERNVLTLEDPIEYGLDGISQTQVSDRKGMTFASGLRSVLRQDPDVIMVGEIRDQETAAMAIQSALTGHLVFSTLHTNDAASAVARLLDLGIEPYLLASSVVGVLAQRLVRRVCPACGRPAASTESLRQLGVDPTSVSTVRMMEGVGCAACRGTGFSGRFGLFELLTVDDAVRDAICRRATASHIKAAAAPGGLRNLQQDGIRKVLAGLTTVEEVLRVTMRTNTRSEPATV